MAQAKVGPVLIFLLFLASLGAGLSFHVEIDAVTDYDLSFLRYRNTTTGLQEVNATLTNSGSIGCTYRLRARFTQNGTTYTRFSDPYPLYAGEMAVAEVDYLPLNYTGRINTSLAVVYCGQEKEVGTFTFNMTRRVTVNRTFNSTTVAVDEDGASIRVPFDRALLVPQDAPPYWKVSSAAVGNGTATVTYDAPVFDRNETLTYTVLNESSGEVLGAVRVELQDESTTTLLDRLRRHAVAVLLVLSLLLNLVLLARYADVGSKVKF